ncbi:glycosyl transferase [Pedobacter ginsengisoli]|jgi:Sugar transferases involved in lipopolysaccharide synthesis|uniref:Glycosyl transferase n=1 Tax=Pedobacter ginsengisoli TaxID=363852 RepID=A0A2D1U3K0_9SPHI|nr:sugar transferase [Pedobacter ginsengisoli]ATP56094.1 glycosyl transferase [Pedobacter ginsengisoli]
MNAKRVFDVVFSLGGMLFLSPLFIVVVILLKLDSRGSIFYKQIRVGLNQKNFELIKFRTMYTDSDRAGLLTIGDHDSRITRVGCWLRKYKIDELPQLINILKGEMSFVGPRPEVLKYVALYDASQIKVLSVKPGITDWASIQYIDENQLLATAEDPESFYINTIIPSKITQNLKYIDHHNIWVDLKIISYTLKSIIRR